MLGSCCCFFSQNSEPIYADRDPVLLISGMGGSILEARKKPFGFKYRVWISLLLADLEFKMKLWSIYNPNTGYTEPLDKNVEISVPDDDYGLYAIDILDPSLFVKLVRLTDVYHFHDIIDMLVECGYKKGTTLFGYGYDFRQSNRIDTIIDGLKEKIEKAYEASGGRKVNIISHSMGGLLVTCFLSLHKDVFSKYVNKWIAIACPFQGAPGCINDSLLTGLQFVEGFESFFFVGRWTFHQLLVECPSIYEMLPNPEFNWAKTPEIQVWMQSDKDGETSARLESYTPADSIALFQEALRNNEVSYGGKKVALPFNLAILKWASGTRKILSKAELPKEVSFYSIFGTSNDTPLDVCYGSESSPIENMSDICHTIPQYTYVDGDGTVPTESAKADGFAAVERIGVSGTHRGLLSDKEVLGHIQRWLGISQKTHKMSSSKKTNRVMDMI
ncbi:phospholipase A(1) LCAT3-like [Impatiens glandulifera]|uniref:phospholipase A(1) LCAT3-like n=1 Tax=Impatiens glandulifera TaxID=253017 RepID=UPI001FB15672|nr:phospholipase A(1) LCAT3-like [Impatiens glandulifera]